MTKRRRTALGTLAMMTIAAATPAGAAWQQATTKHFVVYADEKPDAIQRRATDLETADAALRVLHASAETDGAEANKLTIYVVRNLEELRRVYGSPNSGVAGFYLPESTGPLAFTPAVGEGRELTDLNPRVVLFHEYAHHFLLGNYASAYPAWFSEGYAEFVSTLKIDPDQVTIGLAATHRAFSLFADDGLDLAGLFAPPRKLTQEQLLSIYARGWLLTHYLLLNPERTKQLERYLDAVNAGTPGVEAATAAFGDLRALRKALDKYMIQPRLPVNTIRRSALPAASVTVRALTPGEAAMIETRLLSTRGVNARTAATVFTAGTRVAQRFPQDAVVQGWYAEMAYDAGRDDIADQAADRALALDPDQAQALLFKARIRMRAATKGTAGAAAWHEARAYIVRANKLSNDNAAALALYYRSFVAAGQAPTKNAIAALVRAQQLVPQAPDLRLAVVRQYLIDDQAGEARRVLLPLAYDPHLAPDSFPRKLLEAIEAKADRKTLQAMFDKQASDDKAKDGKTGS